MNEINWSNCSFLIVDDVRLCRFNVLGILKNLGSKVNYSAMNGAEALEILEDDEKKVDCVISDFKMPVMNGLQLLKAIRTGRKNIRRNLPVAMLTGYGDENLVGLAIKLDVNAFLLKPANKGSLTPRLHAILQDDHTDESWLRQVSDYEAVDINSTVANLLEDDPSSLLAVTEHNEPLSENEVLYRYDNVPENYPLSRDLRSKNGSILYPSGTVLTRRHITRLKGLKDLGFWDGNIWIVSPKKKEDKSFDVSFSDDASYQSAEGDYKRSTLSRLGKLSIDSDLKCSRCQTEFSPSYELIRLHNRGELTKILCPACMKRDNELMCACVRLMILKGGFPLNYEEILQSFYERNINLGKGIEDPFAALRSTYGSDPLSEEDIQDWVRGNFFILNKSTNQVECMINRIMSNPDRVRLLGKEGLAGRHMAMKRSQHSPK